MRRLLKWGLRLWLCAALAFAAITLLGARLAWARTERVLGDFGRHLMRYADAHHQSEPSELLLNGASFFFSVGAADGAVVEVLDHFHAACAERGPQVEQLWRSPSLPAGLLDTAQAARPAGLLDGVLRMETEGRGVIACLDTGGQALDAAGLMTRLQRFLDTGDASAVGDLRYVMVGRGERGQTVFVTAWTDGPLNVKEMFPEEGDAPGFDLPGLPRPEGSRRMLSAFHRGGEDLLALYTAPMSIGELQEFYLGVLRGGGFTIDGGGASGQRFITAHRGNVMISLALTESDGQTMAVTSRQASNVLSGASRVLGSHTP